MFSSFLSFYQSFYLAKAKKFGKDGLLNEAMKFLKTAQSYKNTDKVSRRIEALQAVIDAENESNSSAGEEDDEQGVQVLQNGMKMDKDIYEKLYPHQREGVQWMWDAVHQGNAALPAHRRITGGLLSDDMGLGKTIQVAAFISALLDMGEARHFLIIVPTSLIPNWEEELRKWVPNVAQYRFSGDIAKKARERQLYQAQASRSAVVIASYGVCRTSADVLNTKNGRHWTWPYMILDEAHNIKNSSRKSSKAIHGINSSHRLLLTGTPVMNKLVDFYNLMDVMSKGTILDMNQVGFKMNYQKPIETGRKKCASSYEVHKANMLSRVIRDKTEFWILRQLPPKNDFVLWCRMTHKQLKIYNDFLSSEDVRNALMTRASPLVQCTVLKKICDHPRRMANNAIKDIDLDLLLSESGKMQVLADLVDAIIPEKILIFSQSIKILDIIAKILDDKTVNFIRMDGKDKLPIRDEKVKRFQSDKRIKVFMLTTGVGAVGLTLTAATRVIVYDPDWNPGRDDQAVDRAYRIGQTRPVVVFRLITCETIEEKIYSRQLFKKSIISQNNGENDDPTRLFSDNDIRALFKPPVSEADKMFSETQQKLAVVAEKRKVYPELNELLDKLDGFQEFHAGIHDHDLAFDAPDVQKEELNEGEKMKLRDDTANAAGSSQEVKKYYPKGVALPNPIRAPQRDPLSENPNVLNQYPLIYPKPENTMSEGSLSEGKARIFGNSHTFIKPEKTGSYSENKWKKPEPPKPPMQQPQETISLLSSEEEPSPTKTEAKIYRAENIYTDSPYFNRGKIDAIDLTVDENTKKRLFPNSPSVNRPENASKVSRRSKLNLDAQSDESDGDDGMDMDIVGGAANQMMEMKGGNDSFEQSFLRPVLPSLNSTMAQTKRVATLIDDDLNESVSNMSIGDDEAFESNEDNSVTPVKKQVSKAVSVLDQAETTQRMAPGEFKFDSFDMGSSTSASQRSQSKTNKTADSTMSGVVDLPQELDLKKQADEYDSDRTASSCDLEIDERTRIIENSTSQKHQKWTSSNEKVHELTTEEASNLLFGESDSDDSTDPPAKNTSGGVNVSDSQSIERTTSYLPSFSVPETQQPPANSGFFDSQADLGNVSSVIAETTEEIIDDSDEEYNKILQNVSQHASAKKKKFKRRSQLPVRPETDDEEDELIGDSQLEDMEDDMASFLDDGDSEIAESDVADDESMDADDYSASEDERPVAKSKSKYGRIISMDSDESDDNDETPNSLDSDEEEDFGRKPARRKMIINSDSESD
ncbi:unnamed protein product [Oikopleura dioica]|uniref:Uncharacterized protein n=1 Tax=Oikopleura dioica TaxID=34765 RepID=E4YKV0_OIKDI|nr:unnamed protein product [Oikopleura dioica]